MSSVAAYPAVIGKLIHTGEYHIDKDEEDVMVRCELCGKWMPEDEAEAVRWTNGEQKWCKDCVLLHALECDHCGELVSRAVMASVYTECVQETWCDECISDAALVCDRCSCNCDDTYSVEVAQGVFEDWCHDCWEDHSYACDECGEYTDCDTVCVDENGNEITLCRNCQREAWECDHCGSLTTRDFGDSNITLCFNCYEDHYGRCDCCEELYENSELTESRGRYLCPVCMEDQRTQFLYLKVS